jgi:hypothetical protein
MATTTPNFGWAVPTSTDLVKDGAVAIETLGDAIDASLLDLKGGTTNQVLAKNSNTDMDFKWVADASGIPATILDAKGDLIAATAADTASRLAVGANGTVLTADSAEATGLKWASASSPSYTWTSYTPTVGAATGSITTSSATGKYIQIGKFIFVVCQVVITNNGTGGGSFLSLSAPFANVGDRSTGLWRENAATGNAGQVSVSGSSFLLATMTNGYPAASGYTLFFGIGYEVA